MKTVKLISIALAGALLVLSACKKDEPGSTPTSEKCKASDYPQVTEADNRIQRQTSGHLP